MANSMESVDLLITDGLVLTMDAQHKVIEEGAIAVSGGRIVEMGTTTELKRQFQARKTISAKDHILMPGLINAHTHSPMTLLRGIADDLPLMEWLTQYIFPAEGKNVTEAFVRAGTRLACLEMLLGGTTTCVDMYYFEDALADEVSKAGMRGVLGQSLIDFPVPDSPTFDHSLELVRSFAKKWKGHALIRPAVAAHSPYTLSTEHLKEAYALASELDIPYIIHVAEDISETNTTLEKYDKTPVRYLDSIGVLSKRTIAAHMIWLDAEEIEILAKRGVGISHNPESNMKLAAGISPVPAMLAAGVNVGLGTDGAASNNDLDMWSEMNFAAKLHKVNQKNPALLKAHEALEMATSKGAAAIGWGDEIGSLEIGKRADILLIDTEKPHLSPMYNPTSHLVYAARASDVATVIVEGKVVVENGECLTLNRKAILNEAKEWRDRIRLSLSQK